MKLHSKKRKNRKDDIGRELLTDEKRYLHEQQEYELFLRKMENEDADYMAYMIELLINEVKFSSLLEINRGNTKDRFMYPFDKMHQKFFRCDPFDGYVEVDINENNLISCPWNRDRYVNAMRNINKDNEFTYMRDNHFCIYYEFLNITCAYNGFHSLGIGAFMGKGKIIALKYDVTKIFEYVDANPDLSFSYNTQAIKAAFGGVGIPIEYEQFLNNRFYGTDYRLMLIYMLSKQLYRKNNGVL